MKAICFYFQIHQPFRLKRYRFFDIGNDHYYYDDFANDDIITRIAHRSYIPAAEALLRMIENTGGKFRCALSITGTALDVPIIGFDDVGQNFCTSALLRYYGWHSHLHGFERRYAERLGYRRHDVYVACLEHFVHLFAPRNTA